MQNGDLGLWDQPRLIVILEGVLVSVTEQHAPQRRFRKPKVASRNFHWLSTPIKRLVYLKNHWPDSAIEVVTFLDQEAADEAAFFFEQAHIPVSAVSYRPFDKWVVEIRWQPDIRSIFDSDEERIQQYGQLGHLVSRGDDFA